MEKQDTQRLFNLIKTLYPSSRQQPRTPADLEAWTLVLEPWAYEDAKQAVILRARENRFPPDASELVPYLPKPETPKAEEAPMPEPFNAYLEKFYAEAGIPTPSEAKKQGMTYAAWCALADMRGV
mgnify:CR=1 FL=1